MRTELISNLLTNRVREPLGLGLGECPRLSWDYAGPSAAFRVTVSNEESFDKLLYDSGVRTDINPACFPLDKLSLLPRTRYNWKVSVGDTAASWFETGKLGEPWEAEWITPDFGADVGNEDWHPVLFARFRADKEIKEARAYMCGLGLYEARINGEKVGDDCLSPGLCAYDKWLPYTAYDVIEFISTGDNIVEVELGNGWYKGRYGLNRKIEWHYGEEFALILEIHLRFADGSEQTITTSPETWKARRSNVIRSSIFDGEVRDDTLDTSTVYGTKQISIDKALLEPRVSPPVKVMHTLKPIALITTPYGDTILDMGQNMVGWLEFTSDAPHGSQQRLEFGEILQSGEFYRDNLRTAVCEYVYLSDGVRRVVRPKFTFFGFRYVRISGWEGIPDINDFTGLVLYTEMESTGSIETGSERVNRLFLNALWGQRGNYMDVPTDCPQRDERMGWTGDAQVFFGTGAYNMDVYAFFTKFIKDLMKEQSALGGDVPVVIPKHDVWQTGACAWGDAACIIPWQLYERYGDLTLLREQYTAMRGWVDHLNSLDDGSRLWKGSFHYGDWLSLDVEDAVGYRFGGTERTYLASCFYRYSSLLVAKAAEALGYADDALRYRKLSDEVCAAIRNEYFTHTGRLAVNTQTAYILALQFDIAPEEWRARTAYTLRMKLIESGGALRTGFIGTPYLCRVLSENGYNDMAYDLLLREEYPGWLYEVNMGATTIWERWNSVLPDGTISDTGMNSLNHYSYGSIVEWMYRNAAGIRPLDGFPGFARFALAPQPDPRLGWVKASYRSASGLIESEWTYNTDHTIAYSFTVPSGTTAELSLPDGTKRTLAPGKHEFHTQVKPREEIDVPISEILSDKNDADAFAAKHPNLSHMMLFPMLAGDRTLRDLKQEGFDINER
ncbi:alfa-L-rhamnosidase [Clostridia bacterium]|nr:alfa-L-rhamnosidase [Clostridia bacterium]